MSRLVHVMRITQDDTIVSSARQYCENGCITPERWRSGEVTRDVARLFLEPIDPSIGKYVHVVGTEQYLDALGLNGCELVTVSVGNNMPNFFFKRRIWGRPSESTLYCCPSWRTLPRVGVFPGKYWCPGFNVGRALPDRVGARRGPACQRPCGSRPCAVGRAHPATAALPP